MVRVTGSTAPPVSADAVMAPETPTFAVATAKKPARGVPARSTMPSLPRVVATAAVAGMGVGEAEKRSVLMPEAGAAGLLLEQAKRSCTSVGGMGALGVRAKTKL